MQFFYIIIEVFLVCATRNIIWNSYHNKNAGIYKIKLNNKLCDISFFFIHKIIFIRLAKDIFVNFFFRVRFLI